MDSEIELLERVLFRLGTAETDEQLEATVIKFLTPVLLKITSPHEAVRLKVMEILTHVNKRLKSRPAVQLPVENLLTQYQNTTSAFLHNFSIIYISMGFPRLSVEKQTELAPILLNCLEIKPENHQDKLLMLVLPLLETIKIPDDPEKRSALLGLGDKPITKKQFLALLQDVLLIPYGVTADADVPPGLSPYAFKRVNVNNWKAEDLENLKKGVCRFLCSGVFSDEDVLAPLVIASSDTRFSVATRAIAELNKINRTLDWTSASLTAPIYTLFLGNASKVADRKTSACSPRLRQKLLQYLLKGKGNGVNVVRGVQVIFEGLFGENTNQKCKVLALQFTKILVKEGPKELIDKISKVLLSGLTKLIGIKSNESYDIQNAAYVALAQLAYVCPDIVNRDLQLVISCFDHLLEAPVELHNALREALIAIAPAFRWDADDSSPPEQQEFVPNANQNLLLAMLNEHIESSMNMVQNVVCIFLTTCFPQHFVPARYLLLLLANDGKSSLKETISQHLYGAIKSDHINYSLLSSVELPSNEVIASDDRNSDEQNRVVLPSFKHMITYVCDMVQKRSSNSSTKKFAYGQVIIPFSYEVYQEFLEYLRLCLWTAAGIKANPDDIKNPNQLNDYILRNYEPKEENELQKYVLFVKQILRAKRGLPELFCLFDLLNADVPTLAEQCFDLLESLEIGLKDASEPIRVLVAKIIGILWAARDEAAFNDEVTSILQSLNNRSLEYRHGSLLAISNGFNRRIKRFSDQNYNSKHLKDTVLVLCSYLGDQQSLLVSAACKGLSIIGSVTALPLPDGKESSLTQVATTDDPTKMQVDNEDEQVSKLYVMNAILKLLKSAHSRPKTREEAAVCLGLLAIGDGQFFTERNLNEYLKLLRLTKDVALNIAIAQGIVNTILGYDNNTTNDYISEKDRSETIVLNKPNPFCNDEQFSNFLTKIIKIVPDPSPSSRVSSAIWLLALVKNCSNRSPIYTRRQVLQYAFTELLSDDSEFVQDVASRGLGLVFNLSGSTDQKDLTNSLLDQLIGGRRQVNQVNEDTQLFEEGQLGKTPTGGNITTYKELCSLASDLNQPEMIYQFMQLANHNAAWNSKLGAAFGLKSISSGAKEQMQPYLGNIVPRLYRYKYDPTPKIQNSMCSIWDSIVTDSKEVVEKHYWAIMNELLTNMTSNEWRVRIACCLATRDLIKRGNGLRLRVDDAALAKLGGNEELINEESDTEPELLTLWSQLFRVMDDVHEGTRLAAEGTAKILSKICIVAASSSHSKSATVVAKTILPLILDTGITHTVAEIRQLSMKTLSELIESSGSNLTPHIATLVPCLLKASGELETPRLSYLSTQLGGHSEAQEMLDSVRAEQAKQHQSTETLTKCIRFIDIATLDKMTPQIVELIKTTVNLGTKIATAHFICLVSVRFGQEMQHLVGKYLSACFNSLKDRNNIVRKYYASAIGHLIGLAKDQSIVRLFAKLTELYFENQSNKSIPQTILAINKRYPDTLKDYSKHILPLIFFSMHEQVVEENRTTVELWKDLWNEVSPGDAGISMNMDSIAPTLEKCLEDPSWAIKAQSAHAINTIATKLGSSLKDPQRNRLIEALLKSVGGRTFQGKERVLQALASLCDGLKKNDEDQIYKQVIDAVMKECHKEEPVYRMHALRSMGDILEKLNEDRFEEVYNMVWYLLDKKDLGGNDDEALTADDRNKRALIFINLKDAVCETLGKAWPADSVKTQEKYQRMFVERCVQCLQTNTRPVQLALLVALGKFVNRLKCLEKVEDSNAAEPNVKEKKQKFNSDENVYEICKDIISAIVLTADIPHTGLKKEALNILLILLTKLSTKGSHKELNMVKTTYANILPSLQKDNTPEIKLRLKDIEEKLKTI